MINYSPAGISAYTSNATMVLVVDKGGEPLQYKVWPKALVPALFLLYIALAGLRPSQWYAIFLGLAVYTAARVWEVPGGMRASLLAAAASAFGLWRLEGTTILSDPLALGGYAWAAIALGALGYFVGNLTHQARTIAQANENLRQAQQRLTALHKIAISLSTTLDIDKLMEIILEQLGQLWGYDFGAILLLDDLKGDLVLAAERGYDVEPGYRLKATEGITGAVIQSGELICVGDVTKDHRYIHGLKDSRSELAVPLNWEGRTFGVLNVESRQLNGFGPADITLLSTVAEQAAAAIGNARLHQETQQAAITDAHTGLFNYRHFQERVGAVVREAQLMGFPCSLIMMDLDHFKHINDTYGHPTGDEILQQVAQVLRETCRSGDSVFRYGGEEFAMILPGAGADPAVGVAERIRERIARERFVVRSGHKLDLSMTVSLGVATYPNDAISAVDLLIAADKALYSAKGSGRNQVVRAADAVGVERR